MWASHNQQVGLNKAFLFAHILDPHFKHGPPGASAENKKSLWEALEEDGVKIALSMLTYSSHEQNTLSVVNGMSQQARAGG